MKKHDCKVPNIEYENDRNTKFVCGVGLKVNNLNYFVPVSSYKQKERTNLLINDKETVLGSLRFSFMLPCPPACVKKIDFDTIQDEKYKRLLFKEYSFVKSNECEIKNKANEVYRIGCDKKHFLNKVCCDFKVLENACNKYAQQIKLHNDNNKTQVNTKHSKKKNIEPER